MTSSAGALPFVDHDLYCARCEYNLRMQPRDGSCPECGASVNDAYKNLALMSQRRMRWMQVGLWLLILSCLHSLTKLAWSAVGMITGHFPRDFQQIIGPVVLAIAVLLAVRLIPSFVIRALLIALWFMAVWFYVRDGIHWGYGGTVQRGLPVIDVAAVWLITVRLTEEQRRWAIWARLLVLVLLTKPIAETLGVYRLDNYWLRALGTETWLVTLAVTFSLLQHLICTARQLTAITLANYGRPLVLWYFIFSGSIYVVAVCAGFLSSAASAAANAQLQAFIRWFWFGGQIVMTLWLLSYAVRYALYLRRHEKAATLAVQSSP